MGKISINLLPKEFTEEQAKRGKFYKIQALGISVILLMVFLSVLSLSLRIFQSNRIKLVQTQASEIESKVLSYSSKQASLVLLKDRLSAIQNYAATSSKQAEMYNLVNDLLPPELVLGAVSVGRDGDVLISALAPDSDILNRVFSDLLDKEKNENKISKVSIEALNRGRDSLYRVSFKVEAVK